MTSSKSKSAYWQGARQSLPFVLVIGPFAVLFGVVGTEAGLNLAEVMGFSILAIAGSAQFTALQLMLDDAPTLIVIATALAVNLRMAMYSASITAYLGALPFFKRVFVGYLLVDQTYAVSQMRYEANPSEPLAAKLAFFAGVATPMAPLWYACTYLGAVIGEAIPPEFALDFAVPITFLALIGPALRTVAHVTAAFTSVALTLAFLWMPYGTGLLIAAAVAMCVGALVETWQERAA